PRLARAWQSPQTCKPRTALYRLPLRIKAELLEALHVGGNSLCLVRRHAADRPAMRRSHSGRTLQQDVLDLGFAHRRALQGRIAFSGGAVARSTPRPVKGSAVLGPRHARQ